MSTSMKKCPLVLYGSQSGNAADVADKIWRSALLCGAKSLRDVRVRAMDTYLEEIIQTDAPLLLPDEWAVIFVCSTSGQGDPPDNMIKFWKKIMRRAVPMNAMQGLQSAVFGLGDSSYPKYNFVAKKLYRRVSQLGATMLSPLGLADDQHPLGIDGALSPWLKQLLMSLVEASGDSTTLRLDGWSAAEIPCKFSVSEFLSANEVERAMVGGPDVSYSDEGSEEEAFVYPSCAFQAKLVSNQRITSEDHFQDTRHVIFAPPASFPTHRPGQVLMVQPRNSEEDVATLFSILHPNLRPSRRFMISSAHPRCHPAAVSPSDIPRPCSLGWLARHCLDINSVPRKSFFELLSYFSSHPDERERLQEFADANNLDELYTYCYRPRRTCLEVLQDFPQTTRGLTPTQLLEVLPWIRPRAFSLASSARAHSRELHLLMAVVNYKSASIFKRRRGLCSNYLAFGVAPGDNVSVWLASTPGLRFPAALDVPLVMVGPGTGLAPFRSAIHERKWLREATEGSTEKKETKDLLFFGCRFADKDFYFADEWQSLRTSGHLQVITAFSRENTNSNGARMYVQDRLRENSSLVWKLLAEDGAHFYVAGNARDMPNAVREAVMNAAVEHGGLSLPDAESFVLRLEREGRYQAETWS